MVLKYFPQTFPQTSQNQSLEEELNDLHVEFTAHSLLNLNKGEISL